MIVPYGTYLKEPRSSIQLLQGIPGEQRSILSSVIGVDLLDVGCPPQGAVMHEERNPIIAVGDQEFRSPGVRVRSWYEQTHARSEEYTGHHEHGSTASLNAEGGIGRKAEAQDIRLFPA